MTIISNNPPYPGTPLKSGSTGYAVLFMQQQLNIVATRYTAINRLNTDSKFGSNTTEATKLFQKQFSLSPDGIIGELTWNKIEEVADAVDENKGYDVTTEYPGVVLSKGSQGDSVRFVQSYVATVMDSESTKVDGIYGSETEAIVSSFQLKYNLSVDGKVGPNTWSMMIKEFNRMF